MSLDALIMLAGFLVALIPFLGFPISWQVWMFFILGLSVIALGIAVRRMGKAVHTQSRTRGEFVESTPKGIESYDIEARNDKHPGAH